MNHENDLFYNRYRLLESFGRGGFSIVWKAFDEKSKTMVALKIFMKQDREGVDLCRQEYSKAHDLLHQHIVRPTFFDEYQEAPFLVMPFYQMGTTAKLAGLIDEAEMAKIMAQIGAALDYLHSRTNMVIHNDIKPDNLLISDEGNYMLSDFGISGQLQHKLTQTIGGYFAREQQSAQVGVTPVAYRAPELFSMKNQPKLDPSTASDIWAFGACLYHLASGEPPFGGQGGLSQRINQAAGNNDIGDLLEELPGRFSRNLQRWIKACLSIHPAARPTARQITEAGSTFLRTGNWPPAPSVNIPSASVNEGLNSEVKAFVPGGAARSLKPQNKGAGGIPVWVWALGMLLLCAGGFAVYKINQNKTCSRLIAEADDLFQKKEYATAKEKYAEARACDPFNESLTEKINRAGLMVKIQRYPFSQPPSEGLMAVADSVAGRLRWGYLDTLEGKLIIPLRYDSVTPFSNGQATAWKFNQRYEIGRDGQELNHPPTVVSNSKIPVSPTSEPKQEAEPLPVANTKLPPAEKVDFSISEATVYAGTEVKFTDAFSAAWSQSLKQWDFGDGATLRTLKKNVAHSYRKPGNYDVKLCTDGGTSCEKKQITVLGANMELSRKATIGHSEKVRNQCAAGTDRETTWATGDVNIILSPQTAVELNSTVLYADTGGKVRITVSNSKGSSASVIRYVVRGRSPVSLEDLALTLEPGQRYTLTISPLKDEKDNRPRLENAAACGPAGYKEKNIHIDYGGHAVLFDLTYRF